MKSERVKETLQLAVKLAQLPSAINRNSLQIADDSATIANRADRLHRYAEARCNGDIPETTLKAERGCKNRIAGILNVYGLEASFGGDPRGYSVHIFFPDKSHNTWGGQESGWGNLNHTRAPERRK